MRSLPYHVSPNPQLPKLRYLERRYPFSTSNYLAYLGLVKRVDVDPRSLITLIEDNSPSLKEIYLNEVYLKVIGSSEAPNTSLWIGYPGQPRSLESVWIAQSLRYMEGLHLDVLRATGLGYDVFNPDRQLIHPVYDLNDPSGLNRSFDQRFVEAVNFNDNLAMDDPIPPAILPDFDDHGRQILSLEKSRSVHPQKAQKSGDYDAEIYQQHHNTTSHYKRCIDGYFLNHNEQALQELQRIMNVADRGMNLITEEIERSREARVVPDTGLLDTSPLP